MTVLYIILALLGAYLYVAVWISVCSMFVEKGEMAPVWAAAVSTLWPIVIVWMFIGVCAVKAIESAEEKRKKEDEE